MGVGSIKRRVGICDWKQTVLNSCDDYNLFCVMTIFSCTVIEFRLDYLLPSSSKCLFVQFVLSSVSSIVSILSALFFCHSGFRFAVSEFLSLFCLLNSVLYLVCQKVHLMRLAWSSTFHFFLHLFSVVDEIDDGSQNKSFIEHIIFH